MHYISDQIVKLLFLNYSTNSAFQSNDYTGLLCLSSFYDWRTQFNRHCPSSLWWALLQTSGPAFSKHVHKELNRLLCRVFVFEYYHSAKCFCEDVEDGSGC